MKGKVQKHMKEILLNLIMFAEDQTGTLCTGNSNQFIFPQIQVMQPCIAEVNWARLKYHCLSNFYAVILYSSYSMP